MRLLGFGITVLYILIILAGRVVTSGSLQQAPTSTPIATFIANGQVICYLIPATPTGNTQTPNPHPVFQTATAAASISPSPSPSPTKTTVAVSSPTVAATGTLATPTQEFATLEPTRMTVQIAAINVRNAASLTAPIQYVVTQGQLLNVTPNTVINGGYVWRQLTDGFWMVEKNLSNGQVWLQ